MKLKNYSSFFYLELTLTQFFDSFFSKPKEQIVTNIIFKKKLNNLLIYVFIHKKKQKKNKRKIDNNNILNNNKYKSINKNISNYLNLLKIPLKPKIFVTEINFKTLKKDFLYSLIFNFFKKKKKIPNSLYLFNLSLYCQNIQLLTSLLEQNLYKTKQHKWYLKSINYMFKNLFKKYSNFLGYKIQLKGRLNGKPRSSKMVIQYGKVPLNTINSNLKYSFKTIETPYGVCGLKVWLNFSNLNK